jgi:hypothetical protein
MNIFEYTFKNKGYLFKYIVLASNRHEADKAIFNIDGEMTAKEAISVKQLSAFSNCVFEPTDHKRLF